MLDAAHAGATRHAGVLLHPSSLPGPGPIGTIGPWALAFLDWMKEAGLDTWQVLALHPVGPGHSPYASPSAFAADPRLISVEDLVARGLLEPVAMPWGRDAASWDLVDAWQLPLVRQAAARIAPSAACRAWVSTQAMWLPDWGLYAALSEAHGGGWWDWPAGVASRRGLVRLRKEHADAIAIAEGVQYLFHLQWDAVRARAKAHGIRLLGDVPIFVSGDGCDTWANRDLFRLGVDGRPSPVAGVPPDYFSPTGQRWGNPVYAWDRHAETGFAWWKARLAHELTLVDAVRLDHFRGFCANWCIPADEDDARKGRWEPGPGAALFAALREGLDGLPLVAEDLGEITPDVHALREAFGLPGMKVLQFAFGGDATHPFLPHNFGHDNWVVYTGTHDNDTAAGWYASTDARTQHRFRVTTARDGSNPAWALTREAWASVARTAVAPMQDLLGLGSEARFNTPGERDGNWAWRMRELPWGIAPTLRRMNAAYGRGLAARESEP